MKHIFIIFISLSALISNAQKEQHQKAYHYYDVNLKEISYPDFKEREDSNLFKTLVFESDTALVKKLMYKQVFGKLDQKKHHQLKKLYSLRHQIDTTKSWFIHYIDSIPDKKAMPKESGYAFYNEKRELIGFLPRSSDRKDIKELSSKSAFHRHMTSFDDYMKRVKNEEVSFPKDVEAELLHFYTKNYGFPIEVLKEHKYVKDYNLIVKNFFKESIKQYKVIIIHPDGQFHLSFYENYIPLNEKVKDSKHKLLNQNYFKKQRNKWKRKIKKFS